MSKPDVSKIYGKIKIVDHFADYKVQVVENFADLHVQIVDHFPNSVGKWQLVEHFPDFKIQIVTSFPDFKIKYVKKLSRCAINTWMKFVKVQIYKYLMIYCLL